MAETETLAVENRQKCGKRNNRRLRAQGHIPAVLYGHGKENINLSIPFESLDATLRHGNRFVQLTGAVKEKAFLTECVWDTWGQHVLHVDLARVSEHEKITLSVPIELRGEAPGTKEGGTVDQVVHEVEVECEAGDIPENLVVNINNLELNESISIEDLEDVPKGVKILEDPATSIVHCQIPMEMPEEGEEEEVSTEEPEVIGRKSDEEEGEESAEE